MDNDVIYDNIGDKNAGAREGYRLEVFVARANVSVSAISSILGVGWSSPGLVL